jgi:XTP/dITP diphosphohydrolase
MKKTGFNELKRVFERLHGPRGCLWDKKQTHRSLIPYLKEESDEFIEAMKKGDDSHMKEELGDILLQVMFHAQIASKAGSFDIEDVIDCLVKKLKRRHPHIFGKTRVASVDEIVANWHKIKAAERKDAGTRRTR